MFKTYLTVYRYMYLIVHNYTCINFQYVVNLDDIQVNMTNIIYLDWKTRYSNNIKWHII